VTPAIPETSSARRATLLQVGALLGACLVYASVGHIAPIPEGPAMLLVSVGLMLVAGLLASRILGTLGLPHLTGYLLVGAIMGPHATGVANEHAVEQLASVNGMALALIALAGGAELRIDDVRARLRSLAASTLTHGTIGVVLPAAVFLAITPFVPFTRDLAWPARFALAALWGVLAISRSPAATLAVIKQSGARGPISRFVLTFVMSSDVTVVIAVALTMTVARPWLTPEGTFSVAAMMEVGRELVGSVSIGTTLGLLLGIYLRTVGRHVGIVLFVLGFVAADIIRFLHFDPVLTFLTAGLVITNLMERGHELIDAVDATGGVVYVVFFATAGAHLDLPLVGQLWPAALLLCAGRLLATWLGHAAGASLARDPIPVRRWGWTGLVSQAGLTLGLAVLIARAFPSFGPAFQSLVVVTVAVNEVIGPVLFKLTLDRVDKRIAGEQPAASP